MRPSGTNGKYHTPTIQVLKIRFLAICFLKLRNCAF